MFAYHTWYLTASEFTGISAPYEAPDEPEIHIDADNWTVEQSVKHIVEYLEQKGYI